MKEKIAWTQRQPGRMPHEEVPGRDGQQQANWYLRLWSLGEGSGTDLVWYLYMDHSPVHTLISCFWHLASTNAQQYNFVVLNYPIGGACYNSCGRLIEHIHLHNQATDNLMLQILTWALDWAFLHTLWYQWENVGCTAQFILGFWIFGKYFCCFKKTLNWNQP